MRFPLWCYLHGFLFSLIMVSGISGITLSITSGIATTVVGPVATVVQSATIIAIPGLSSTVTNVGSPPPVLPPDTSSFFITVPATTLVSTGTHLLTDSLTQITVTTSTSSPVQALSSSIPGLSSSGGTSVPSSFQTSSNPSSTPVPVADHTPTTTSEPVVGVGNPSTGSLVGWILGGVGGVALLVGLICWFFRTNRSKKEKRRRRRKEKSVAALAPNGNNPGTPSLSIFSGSRGSRGPRNGQGSDLENGIPLRNMGAASAASNSIAETLSEYYTGSPAPNSSRPTNSRPKSPLSAVGSVSTFAPTFPASNHDETLWTQTPDVAAAYAARNKANSAIAIAASNTPNRPPIPAHQEELAKQLATRTPPPTHLPHIRFEKSPAGLPARRILHPGRQKLANGPEFLYNHSTGSIEEGSKLVKPDGAHYIGISSSGIQYGVMNRYNNDAGGGSAPKDDPDDITQLPGRISQRNLSPEPLKIVKRSPCRPENALQTPTRPQERSPVGMKEDSDESDKELRSEKRNTALESLEGRSPHLTTDKALRKSRISVHSPPPAPVKKGNGLGIGYFRRNSAVNLSPPRVHTSIRPSSAGRKTSSIYSRMSAGIAPPEMTGSAVFEDYKHDHKDKGKVNSAELALDDRLFRAHTYNKRDF